MVFQCGTFIMATCLALLSGCATGGAPAASPLGRDSNAAPGGATRSHDVVEARRLIDSGAYSQALPRLLLVTSQDQQSAQAAEAFYWMGVAYQRIGSLGEASDAYGRSVEIAPDGAYAATAQTAMETIRNEVDAAYVDADELDGLIKQVEQRAAAEPNEVAHRLLLADLHWKRESYDAAGAIYQELLTTHPGLARDRVVAQRMMQKAEGGWTVMTPGTAIQMNAEENPVTLYGVSSFKTTELRGDVRYYNVDFYHVSGYVVNQSQSPVRNVNVDVTIFGFGSRVFDTTSVSLGTLRPGQHRTFAVRFNNFDNVNNVQRYDCQLRYEN